ncbi:DUF155-domain-containing protein [Massarina eburnea CBS 473.64]|uniref:DUF155-domain-containing protein n=1 Tax=Massarina eburnea CBS 473.64 TaxID=1395130 RepID=A0A6A6S2N0_9PLEO|nr:DUF155-domain-containing protein [Massarina eburnea CBS 473.64]
MTSLFPRYALNSLIRSIAAPASRHSLHRATRRPFASAGAPCKKPDAVSEPTPKVEAAYDKATDDRKGARKNVAKTSSLRRVAVEAQRSRGFVKGRGSKKFVDPDVDTKTVTAYCGAETYNISSAARLVKAEGYDVDPHNTGLYPQVIHLQITEKPSEVKDFQRGDIFIFPSGTVVAWNVREREVMHLVSRVLVPAAEGSHLDMLETEDLDYIEDPTRENSEVVGDTIVLGTKDEAETSDASNEPTDAIDEVDTILAKIAFSSGLARSTKLAVLESLLSSYQHSTRQIPIMLAKGESISVRGKNMPFTRSFILSKTGELLNIRAQLNLYSELTDSLPDIFWDSRHELGLGEYYDQVGRALDVGVRIRVLNEKIGFAQEIASVLRETLSEKHGLRLEWAIIALIAVEVVLEFYRHWKDSEERMDEKSTESLLRRYLLKEAGEKK